MSFRQQHVKQVLPVYRCALLFGCAILIIIVSREVSFKGIPILSQLSASHARLATKAKMQTLNYSLPDFDQLRATLISANPSDPGVYDPYIQYYQRVTESFPELSESYGMKGVFYYYTGQSHLAQENFQQAYRKTPTFFWYSYNLGLMAFEDKKYDEAVRYFQAALKTPPQSTLEFINSSRIYKQLGITVIPDVVKHFKQTITKGTIYLGVSLVESGKKAQGENILKNFSNQTIEQLKSSSIEIRMF